MFVKIENQNLHYKAKGNGNPVILLPGWGCGADTFSKLQDALSQRFTVYAVDLPGFGLTAPPDRIWGSDEYTDLVQGFIAKLKISDPIFIGHSFGGKIAIKLAAAGLVKAKKIILINSSGIRLPKPLKIKFRIYIFKIIKLLANLPGVKKIFESRFELYRRKFGSNDYKNARGIMRMILVKSIHEDIKELLPKMKVPVLLIWGDKDDTTPLQVGQIMQQSIVGSKLKVIAGSGHFPFIDNWEEFIIEVTSFLS